MQITFFVWVGKQNTFSLQEKVCGSPATVVLLRRIHLIQITTGFRGRVAGGQGGVDIPGAMLLMMFAACTLSFEKTRSTLPAPPL